MKIAALLPILPVLSALSLAACAPSIETRIHAAGEGPDILQNAAYAFAEAPGTASAAQAQARQIVAEKLATRQWRETADGAYIVTLAISVLPASLEVYETGVSREDVRRIVQRKPKKRTLLGSCAPYLHRLDIKVFRIADGSEVYAGDASEYHCKAGIDETLPYLADAALANMGKPPVSRTERRSGRN